MNGMRGGNCASHLVFCVFSWITFSWSLNDITGLYCIGYVPNISFVVELHELRTMEYHIQWDNTRLVPRIAIPIIIYCPISKLATSTDPLIREKFWKKQQQKQVKWKSNTISIKKLLKQFSHFYQLWGFYVTIIEGMIDWKLIIFWFILKIIWQVWIIFP